MSRVRFFLSVILPVFAILLTTGGVVIALGFNLPPMSAGENDAEPAFAVEDGLHSSSVMFIENAGQWQENAKFQVWGGTGDAMWLAEDAIWITIMEPLQESEQMRPEMRFDPTPDLRSPTSEPRSGVNIKLSFPGANPHPTIETFDRLDTKVSYFLGNDPDQWRPDVPVWGGVRYVDLWPGVDLVVGSQNGRLVQRFVAEEGADVSAVQMRVEGADGAKIGSGLLTLATTVNELTLSLPHADFVYKVEAMTKYGQANTLEVYPVDVASTMDTHSSIAPGDNPADLLYGTFLGGSDRDFGHDIAVDKVGSAYITGATFSSNFPTSPGAFDTTHSKYYDVFVVKINSDGSNLVYATFLGGSSYDEGYDIAVDKNGAAYVTGYTVSSGFPTYRAFDWGWNGSRDAFVVKINSVGSGLAYSTFLGGSGYDQGFGIAVDEAGAAYVTGETYSPDFPTTPGAFDTSIDINYAYYNDTYVVKIYPNGGDLVYATFLGANRSEDVQDIVVDSAGAAYITGFTSSSDFPTTPGAFDTIFNDQSYITFDAFVVKVNSTGSDLAYSSFLGGNRDDQGEGIAVDEDGAAYVTGFTGSSDFPTTPGAFDTDSYGAFVVKFNSAGSSLVYATFLSGSGAGDSITVDEAGVAYIVGYTYSSDFPTTPGAFDTSFNGDKDVFVVKLNSDGSNLLYATFLGGSDSERGQGIAVDETGMVYVTGSTFSSDFPIEANAFDTSYDGNYDAFVVKIRLSQPPPTPTVTLTPTSTPSPSATPTATPSCFDDYEPDNTWQQSKYIHVDSQAQQHNFHQPGDVDYVKFNAVSGVELTLYTDNLGPGVDTTLTLYDLDGITRLACNDIDPLNPPASRIYWTAPTSGTYFLKVTHFNPAAGGCSMTYGLVVERITPTSTPSPTVTATPIPLYLPIIQR